MVVAGAFVLSYVACTLAFNKVEFPAALFAVAPESLNAGTVRVGCGVGVGVGVVAPPRFDSRLLEFLRLDGRL